MNQPALPAYLQNRKSQRVAEGAADGIGGSLPPHISIRGNEFTLVDAAGNKAEVPDKYLDVCFVDRSEVISKQYYEQDYIPGANDPPTCFSANGIAPSIEAGKPQSPTCATCQWNARGSDVSALSGKPIKACRDEKWCAVIAVKYPTMIFQFRVTPGSFKAWKGYTDKFKGQATDLSDVVTRLAFEKGKNGVLTFEATAYIDETIFAAREAAVAEKKTDVLVGRNDKPIQAALAGPAQPPDTIPAQLGPAPFPPAPAAFAPQEPAGEAPKRRRRTKAEMEADAARAAQGAQPNGHADPGPAGPVAPFAATQAPFPASAGQAAPFAPNPPGGAAAPFGIATQAVAPDPQMKGMLDNIFGSPPRSGG